MKKLLLIATLLFCSLGYSDPNNASEFQNRFIALQNSTERGNDLARILLRLQTDLNQSIEYWVKQPESDEQFAKESQLRELSFLWEPLFKVSLDPAAAKDCQEIRTNVDADGRSGAMAEGTIRPSYQRILNLLNRLCNK